MSGRIVHRCLGAWQPALRALPWVLALLAAGCSTPSPLEVTEVRVRAVIPGQDKTVGYFTVRNTTDADIVLSGVSGPQVRAIEMHETVRDGDMVRMRRLTEVVVPAGETVRFEPGGRHLMLFGVSGLDESAELMLETRDGGRFPLPFEIITVGGG